MRPSSPTRTFPSRRCPTWRRPTRIGLRSWPPPSACGPRGGGSASFLLLLLLLFLLLLLLLLRHGLLLLRRLALRLRTRPLILPPNRPSLPRTVLPQACPWTALPQAWHAVRACRAGLRPRGARTRGCCRPGCSAPDSWPPEPARPARSWPA